ncbi:hypothetical protein ACKWTF_002121 [Chironomus riparius]
MTTPSKCAVNVLKDACDRSQSWINNHMEKISNRTNKFSTLKGGYSKMRPKIFPKGLSTFKNSNENDFDQEECDNFLKKPRVRVQSVDVIDIKAREVLKQQFNEETYIKFGTKDLNDLQELNEIQNHKTQKKLKEALLINSNIELKVINACATSKKPSQWKPKNSKEKVYVKSVDDYDDGIKIIPSVLLTYQTKFTKISDNTRRCSLQENYSDSSKTIDITP